MCRECGGPIFFARTVAGELQALDAAPHPDGTVMAYRAEPRLWLARTLPKPRPGDAGEQLALDAVGDDPRPRRGERQPHPLEEPFRPHAQTCAARHRGVQQDLFPPVGSPAPRRPANQPPPRQIYDVKAGAPVSVPAPREGGAKVYEWDQVAPRIAARRRRAATGKRRADGAS